MEEKHQDREDLSQEHWGELMQQDKYFEASDKSNSQHLGHMDSLNKYDSEKSYKLRSNQAIFESQTQTNRLVKHSSLNANQMVESFSPNSLQLQALESLSHQKQEPQKQRTEIRAGATVNEESKEKKERTQDSLSQQLIQDQYEELKSFKEEIKQEAESVKEEYKKVMVEKKKLNRVLQQLETLEMMTKAKFKIEEARKKIGVKKSRLDKEKDHIEEIKKKIQNKQVMLESQQSFINSVSHNSMVYFSSMDKHTSSIIIENPYESQDPVLDLDHSFNEISELNQPDDMDLLQQKQPSWSHQSLDLKQVLRIRPAPQDVFTENAVVEQMKDMKDNFKNYQTKETVMPVFLKALKTLKVLMTQLNIGKTFEKFRSNHHEVSLFQFQVNLKTVFKLLVRCKLFFEAITLMESLVATIEKQETVRDQIAQELSKEFQDQDGSKLEKLGQEFSGLVQQVMEGVVRLRDHYKLYSHSIYLLRVIMSLTLQFKVSFDVEPSDSQLQS